MSRILKEIQKKFPKVAMVVDAKRAIQVTVTRSDLRQAKTKDHNYCVIAVACERQFKLDHAIVGVSSAYLIKGKKATHYEFPERTITEIKAFDKGGEFSPGVYVMSAPRPPQPKKETKREEILKRLRAAGKIGVPKQVLLREVSTETAARICELQDDGFEIKSYKKCPADKLVTYELVKEPSPTKRPAPTKKPTVAKKQYRRRRKTENVRPPIGSIGWLAPAA